MGFKSIKYELNPTQQQKELIRKTCGCCRFVYNAMLDRKIKAYKEDGTSLSAYDLINQLPNFKKENSFLKEAPSVALQQCLLNLETAYKNFFRNGGSGFPQFKKRAGSGSYRIPVACEIDYDNWTIKLPKLGLVKIYRGHNKQICGRIKSCTVSCTYHTDRYFVSILHETEDRPMLNNGKSVGIDMGIKDFAVLSDGIVFENPKYLKKELGKLRVLQRTAARRYQEGKKIEEQSSNWRKAMKQVAKLQEHISNKRKDYLDKVSTWIANHYSIVCVEDLNVKGMEKNKHLAQAIIDCGWRMFIVMLENKCDKVVKIDRFYASSQTCSECGYKEEKVKNLTVREWTCPVCGTHHNRDLNAAKNIEREGLSLCGLKAA